MSEHRGRRLTETRVAELHERIGELTARLDALERRQDLGAVLAQELGQASLRALQRIRPTPTPTTKGRTL